jgi:predicted ATP-grasp superfamily ATP-dependent carboligase
MRVFVFEYVSGGGCADHGMLAGLLAEGDMMLAAAVCDLLEIQGVEVIICRDCRLGIPALPIRVEWVDDDWEAAWRSCLQLADAVLPIAPETGGILERLCRDVEAAGRTLLNSGPEAVALAASKQATLERLAAEGVPVVSSWRADRLPPLDLATLVVKPDMGVGCQDVCVVSDERALGDLLARKANPGDWLVQPYVPGQAASLSLMVGDDYLCLLGCNLQRIAQVDDGFMLLGCVVNGLYGPSAELFRLAEGVCRAIPGLWGYVGVDLVIGEEGPVVLEVNPRLTTSYIGLSQSIGHNVAGLLLRLAGDPGELPGRFFTGNSVHVDLEHLRVA